MTRALKSFKKLHFDWFLLCKVFNVWPKKAQRSYLSWHWKVMQNLNKNWFVVWKMTWGIWQIFTRALESVKIGNLMESFCPKEKKYELKNLQRSYVLWQWRMIQNLKRNWIVVLKLTWGISQILTRALESLQNSHFKWALSDQRI